MTKILMACALLLGVAGCPTANDDDSAGPEPTPALDEPASWTAVFELIAFRCGCHDAVEQASDMFDLTDEDGAWNALVGVPSQDVPSMARIEPGDAENSYLVRKIEDRHRSVGGAGDRMPPTGFALPADDISMIREWIDDGALRE